MTDDLIAFVRTRLDHNEHVAKKAAPRPLPYADHPGQELLRESADAAQGYRPSENPRTL